MRDIDPGSLVAAPAVTHKRNMMSVQNIIENALGDLDITSGEAKILFEFRERTCAEYCKQRM